MFEGLSKEGTQHAGCQWPKGVSKESVVGDRVSRGCGGGRSRLG